MKSENESRKMRVKGELTVVELKEGGTSNHFAPFLSFFDGWKIVKKIIRIV